MRKSFERSLEQYREVAREMEEAKKPDAEPLDIAAIDQELEFLFARGAKANKTEVDTQSAIFETQRYKQEIMTALRAELRRIDAREKKEVGDGQRFVRMEGEQIVWDRGKGDSVKMTLGELLTDGEWGMEYVLDVESIPRQIQKQYAVGEAKRQLLSLLNEQLVLAETGRSDVDPLRAKAFEGNLDLERKKPAPGFIAERGVGNFLKKLSIDLGVDIEVVDATVYHDVVQKVDFMVKIGSQNRGVDVDTSESQFVGFQFTTDTRSQTRYVKNKMIRRAKNKYLDSMPVDDILLVVVPMQNAKQSYGAWNAGGQMPGGPDAYWSKEVRELVMRHVFAGVDSEIDIDDIVEKLPAQRRKKKKRKKRKTTLPEKRENPLQEHIEKRHVFGTPNQLVRAEVLYQLAKWGGEKGVDLQSEFQLRLNNAEDNPPKPNQMLSILNELLTEQGINSLDPEGGVAFPHVISKALKKLGAQTTPGRRWGYTATVLFPPRNPEDKKLFTGGGE